jgi:hypothetical protein
VRRRRDGQCHPGRALPLGQPFESARFAPKLLSREQFRWSDPCHSCQTNLLYVH